jgi:SAM-dependent methyltransferase
LSCPICDETAAWSIPYHCSPEIDAWRAEAGDRSSYAWRLCRRCGNGYPTVQPDLRVLSHIWESARAVDDHYPAASADQWRQRRDAARVYAERSYRLFAPLLGGKTGRFLDIACGLGETVRTFADRGWDAEGVDADPTMLAFHQELAIRSRIGQIENLEITSVYDIVHISHAIYFITNPMRLLGQLRRHLMPDGVLCLVLSNFMSSLEPNLPAYSHTFYPCAGSMRYALALAGFATVFVQRRSGSIYMAARPAAAAPTKVNTTLIHWLYRTKALRFATIGRCARLARPIVRKLRQ